MARESKGGLDIEIINTIDKSDKVETIEKKTWLMNVMDNPFWNLFLLALAWAMTLTTSTLLISIGPLVAHDELGADGKLNMMNDMIMMIMIIIMVMMIVNCIMITMMVL
jgi:hypothetical protein